MLNAVIELAKYILVINILIYTVLSFFMLRSHDASRKTMLLVMQNIMIFINHITGSLVLLSSRRDLTYFFLSIFQVVAIFAFLVLMRAIYPTSNRLILNHVAMLLSISFVVLTRLSFSRSIRQFAILAVSMIVALVIPTLMKKQELIRKCEWLYAIIGIAILAVVLVRGSISNGSKLAFSILGISFQPSEFVKIIYVLFLAGLLLKAKKFIYVVISAVIAATHVLILVASKDLGSALIFFITYVVMVFVATRRYRYIVLGMSGAAIASYVAYLLFSHVRVRVAAWMDPWSDIDSKGYQIAQSLFGIGTGGWFGMGIDAGRPNSIPYVEQDFIFSAICEEYGVIFGICLIAICINLFMEIVHVAQLSNDFYIRYSVYGLGIIYIVQLFLTIGGNTKFIPLTGVTLPLISYGGSSVLASMIMFAVVQGFSIYDEQQYMEGVGGYARQDDVVVLNYGEDGEIQYEDDIVHELVTYPRIHMNLVVGVFTALFLANSIYIAHFVYYDSPQIINNNYNSKRQEILASQTIRGDILSSDGEILATSMANTEERVYPYAEIFSHAFGYDTNGKLCVENDANIYLVSSNIPLIDRLENDIEEKKHMGNTVITTFDTRLQRAAYDALGIYNGAVIVTEPTTGKILAMVSKPDFDPNVIDAVWEELVNNNKSSVLVNRVTQGLYPPGSTFKIITALEYIKQNPFTIGQYNFTCTGRFVSGENTINCYHGINHGTLDFETSFAKSCNSSFANIGLELNRKSFEKTLNKIYFNQSLPVDFSTQISSYTESLQVNDSDMIQTVIGQGETQMTPIHLAMITSMIANEGKMMKPYTIERVETANGDTIKTFSPESLGMFVTKEEAAVLKDLMVSVVEKGTATRLNVDNYDVAGKTGSAEYNSNSDSHAWFTGFTYNTENPLQITVIMEGAGSGGEYAVPVARRILDAYYAEND